MRERLDFRRQPLDLSRDEGAIDEAAQTRVLGRLQLQQRMALDGVEWLEVRRRLGPAQTLAARHMQHLPAEAAIAQQRRHIGVAGEAPEAVALPEEHGSGFADGAIGGIGVLIEFGVSRIELHAAARRVDFKRHDQPSPAGDRRPRRDRGRRQTFRARSKARSATPRNSAAPGRRATRDNRRPPSAMSSAGARA